MVHPGWWTHLDGKWFSLWTFKPLWYKVQYIRTGASLAAQLLKNPPAMQKTLVHFLGGEDPLEKGMATHSSMLAWRIAWTKEPGRLQSMGSQRVGQDWVAKHTVYAHIHTHTHTYMNWHRWQQGTVNENQAFPDKQMWIWIRSHKKYFVIYMPFSSPN